MKLVKYTRYPDPFFDGAGFGFPAIVDRFLNELSAGEGYSTALRTPRTNIRETDSAWEYLLEVPGVSKKDIQVNLEGDRLVIRAGTENSKEEDRDGLVRREFEATGYERAFSVGNGVDREKIKARLNDGVLTVTLPKVAERIGRSVNVE